MMTCFGNFVKILHKLIKFYLMTFSNGFIYAMYRQVCLNALAISMKTSTNQQIRPLRRIFESTEPIKIMRSYGWPIKGVIHQYLRQTEKLCLLCQSYSRYCNWLRIWYSGKIDSILFISLWRKLLHGMTSTLHLRLLKSRDDLRDSTTVTDNFLCKTCRFNVVWPSWKLKTPSHTDAIRPPGLDSLTALKSSKYRLKKITNAHHTSTNRSNWVMVGKCLRRVYRPHVWNVHAAWS